MAITYVGGAANQDAGSASTAVSVTHGLSINANDVIIAIVHYNVETTTCADNNGANSFTEDAELDNAGATSGFAIYSRVAGGSEPSSYAWTLDSSQRWSVALKVFSGVNTSSIYDVTPTGTELNSTSSSEQLESVNITTNNDNSVGLVCFGTDSDPFGGYSGYTNSYGNEVESSSGRPVAMVHKILGTAGAVGTVTASWTGSNDTFSIHFALNESTGTETTITVPTGPVR
jgi:hypothetical protein